jgi:hypothetical protein
MYQQSITCDLWSHPAPGEGHPGGSRIGKPQIPDLAHWLTALPLTLASR